MGSKEESREKTKNKPNVVTIIPADRNLAIDLEHIKCMSVSKCECVFKQGCAEDNEEAHGNQKNGRPRKHGICVCCVVFCQPDTSQGNLGRENLN